MSKFGKVVKVCCSSIKLQLAIENGPDGSKKANCDSLRRCSRPKFCLRSSMTLKMLFIGYFQQHLFDRRKQNRLGIRLGARTLCSPERKTCDSEDASGRDFRRGMMPKVQLPLSLVIGHDWSQLTSSYDSLLLATTAGRRVGKNRCSWNISKRRHDSCSLTLIYECVRFGCSNGETLCNVGKLLPPLREYQLNITLPLSHRRSKPKFSV